MFWRDGVAESKNVPRIPDDCQVIVPFVIDETSRTDVGSVFTVKVWGNSMGREDTVSSSAEAVVKFRLVDFLFLMPVSEFLKGSRLY